MAFQICKSVTQPASYEHLTFVTAYIPLALIPVYYLLFGRTSVSTSGAESRVTVRWQEAVPHNAVKGRKKLQQ